LYRSLNLAALLLKLPKNLVNVHPESQHLTLGRTTVCWHRGYVLQSAAESRAVQKARKNGKWVSSHLRQGATLLLLQKILPMD